MLPTEFLEEPHWQGAEAKVYVGEWEGKKAIFKQRFTKTYRHPTLDQRINSRRVSSEGKILERARKAGLHVPHVYRVDTKAYLIVMECISGRMVKDVIAETEKEKVKEKDDHGDDHTNTYTNTNTENNRDEKEGKNKSDPNHHIMPIGLELMAQKIGQEVGLLHANGIIHGDLTTSNMLIREDGESSLCLIDFGLASISTKAEDRAVDLYVLERAINSTHSKVGQKLFAQIMDAYYKSAPSIADNVRSKLAEVQRRGRKRDMIG